MPNLTEIAQAINAAKDEIATADRRVGQMVELCAGRLRAAHKEGTWLMTKALRDMKRELSKFDSRTGMWKD